MSGDAKAVKVIGDDTNDDDVVREYGSDAAIGTAYTQFVGEDTNDDDVVREHGSDTAVGTTYTPPPGGEEKGVRTTLAGGMAVDFHVSGVASRNM